MGPRVYNLPACSQQLCFKYAIKRNVTEANNRPTTRQTVSSQ